MRTRPNAARCELFKVCADPVTHAGGYWVSGTLLAIGTVHLFIAM